VPKADPLFMLDRIRPDLGPAAASFLPTTHFSEMSKDTHLNRAVELCAREEKKVQHGMKANTVFFDGFEVMWKRSSRGSNNNTVVNNHYSEVISLSTGCNC